MEFEIECHLLNAINIFHNILYILILLNCKILFLSVLHIKKFKEIIYQSRFAWQ